MTPLNPSMHGETELLVHGLLLPWVGGTVPGRAPGKNCPPGTRIGSLFSYWFSSPLHAPASVAATKAHAPSHTPRLIAPPACEGSECSSSGSWAPRPGRARDNFG